MTAGAIGSGRPGAAPAVRPGGAAAALEGRVVGRPTSGVALRPRSAVALGDAATHGEWVRNVETVVQNLAEMFRFVKLMTDDLAAGDCPDDLITEVAAWAETVYRYGRQILAELLKIDGDLRPWIDAVMAAGGPRMVASPRWLEGR